MLKLSLHRPATNLTTLRRSTAPFPPSPTGRIVQLIGLPLAAVLLVALACGPSAAAGDGKRGEGSSSADQPPAGEAASPVVIELFTSQGCSSCPPADRLLARLDADPKLAGKVLPLSFHVDYWNSIGWQDPFSSPAWSRRQERYAQTLRAGRLYTPQLVVAGGEHCVGSRASQVRELIDEALSRPAAAHVRIDSIDRAGATLTVRATARLEEPLAGTAEGAQELMVALVENGLSTQIQSGENAHRTLHNERVVRRLERALTLEPATRTSGEASVTFALDPRWKTAKLEIVAFLQDHDSMLIHGAAEGRVER